MRPANFFRYFKDHILTLLIGQNPGLVLVFTTCMPNLLKTAIFIVQSTFHLTLKWFKEKIGIISNQINMTHMLKCLKIEKKVTKFWHNIHPDNCDPYVKVFKNK